MQLGFQDEGTRGVQHLEAVRLRVREQKELLSGANKEMKRLRKTLKTYEVLTLYHMHTYQPASPHPVDAHHHSSDVCQTARDLYFLHHRTRNFNLDQEPAACVKQADSNST